ncbi:MAG TPA: acetoacetate--CoA ligase [Egibacteraceae bacterium]|nr:acetoacetate--CoA ligase [Egibacteraceae bacterium]
MSEILWTPTPQRIARSHLQRFMDTAPGRPADYAALWEWSTSDLAGFWGKVWQDCGVVASEPYDAVVGELRMPGTKWFAGARLNAAENLLRRRDDHPALVGAGEGREDETVTYAELHRRVARAQQGLAGLGVAAGDRVAGFLPNCVETVVMMLATTALGAVWSSCSPDFGSAGVVERFGQIQPKVLVAADGYRYNGSTHGLRDTVAATLEAIPTIEHVVAVDFAGTGLALPGRSVVAYDRLLANDAAGVTFAQLPFDHPLYVMYSSGTTGPPKSIVHGAGGTLVKHLCEHVLHTDLHAGEDVIFWFTTCGWMMWNWLIGALACGVTVVLYDGSPSHPGIDALWRLAERAGVTHFGTSPKFLAACAQAGAKPRRLADLSRLRAVLSTGAPLNPEQFDWVYANVADDLQLASISGGTDLIGCFAGGVPVLPVRRGELQGRILGMAVEAWNAQGKPVVGEKGELVCTKPFPSMPTGFWGDEDGSRYREAYFAQNPGVWTHGDFVEIRPEGGVVIYGRSDTTLNPGGVRIGTAEIYRAVEPLAEVADAIVVGRPVDGDVQVVLCVKPAEGHQLDDALVERIRRAIREATTPRHVPRHVVAVSDIPYTISGKKVEKAVRDVLAGLPVANRDALANPQSLDEYARLALPA